MNLQRGSDPKALGEHVLLRIIRTHLDASPCLPGHPRIVFGELFQVPIPESVGS